MAYRGDSSLWALNTTKGLHWLGSPRVGRNGAGELVVEGIPGLIDSERLLLTPAMLAHARQHFLEPHQRPLNLLELKPDLDSPGGYVEASRGFLLAPNWSPKLLCAPRPVGIKRSIMNKLSRESCTPVMIWGREILAGVDPAEILEDLSAAEDRKETEGFFVLTPEHKAGLIINT